MLYPLSYEGRATDKHADKPQAETGGVLIGDR
jgi:hypothetical protein